MPPVAAKIPSLKFSVALTRPLRYASNSAASVPNVRNTAWLTMPGYCDSKITEIHAKRDAFERSVDRRGDRRPCLLEARRDRDNEPTDHGSENPHRQSRIA